MTLLKRLLRAPLVHFLLLGGLLFVFFQWQDGSDGPGSNRILITLLATVALAAALVVALRAPWARIAVRVGGSWIAATGLLLVGGSLRAA